MPEAEICEELFCCVEYQFRARMPSYDCVSFQVSKRWLSKSSIHSTFTGLCYEPGDSDEDLRS